MKQIVSDEHYNMASRLRDMLATYEEAEDLINIGAYVKGSNAKIDAAIEIYDDIIAFLQQNSEDESNYDTTLERLKSFL